LNLIILEPGEIGEAGQVRLTGVRALHLLNVLKVEPGDSVRVALLDGPTGTGTVRGVSEAIVDLQCAFSTTIPPRPAVDLLLALPRPKVLRRLWAQLAALGVGRIMLTNAERVERNYFDTHLLTPEVYRSLLIDGLQQARDTRLPIVSVHRRLKVFVEDELDGLVEATARLVADPSASVSAGPVVREMPAGSRVLLAVGPEGGWNVFELDLLRAHRFQLIGLGPRTLRADTACVSLLAVVHQAITEQQPRS
jgi:RsmE family RNA methyltransferase